MSALNKVFAAPADLSFFSVSHGHTYHKPVQQSTSQVLSGPSQQSTENTPMPGIHPTSTDKSTAASASSQEDTESGTRTAWDALRMTLQFGKEYVEDMPLVGEPGNFRFSKSKETASGASKGQQISTGGASTPGRSRAPSTVPPAPANPPSGPKVAKIGEKATTAAEGQMKAKRRKSSKGGGLSPEAVA